MKKILLYSHGGSGNRGCEAIVKGTCKIIEQSMYSDNILLASLNKKEDEQVGFKNINKLIEYNNYVKNRTFSHFKAVLLNRIFGTTEQYISLAQKNLYKLFDSNTLALSIGGDNYCYTDSKWLYLSNKIARKKGSITVLWGCSIEEHNIDNEMKEDLKNYNLIVARESITYNTLVTKEINKNVKLYPDPAFQLNMKEVKLPNDFIQGKTIGINLSPYIYKSSLLKDDVVKLYVEFINHILNNTDSNIALIPHVFWEYNNDLDVLSEVYSYFRDNNKVILINNKYNCEELKYIISKCRLFIGARTHSTIAAYSSCVPTLVLGYSVKSRGIARDIFGSEENMVISVQELKSVDELIQAFNHIIADEKNIREHLEVFMPTYKQKSLEACNELVKLLEKEGKIDEV